MGLWMGGLPYWDLLWSRFMKFAEKAPAVALLPILFITVGTGELSKIVLIVIGTMPTIILDTRLKALNVPDEYIVKAMTFNASNPEMLYLVKLKAIMPAVLHTIRLNVRVIVLFILVAESLAASSGLGYRIFVVKRQAQMDIIIPYVVWISFLTTLVDVGIGAFINWKYKWYEHA